ncbi:MAG: hypothetical protein GY757_08795 [bacterium]|nr:hypothetical protein [bacterium]
MNKEIKAAILAQLNKQDDLTKTGLIVRSNPPRNYSLQELIAEVENETPAGVEFQERAIRLTVDLLARNKRELPKMWHPADKPPPVDKDGLSVPVLMYGECPPDDYDDTGGYKVGIYYNKKKRYIHADPLTVTHWQYITQAPPIREKEVLKRSNKITLEGFTKMNYPFKCAFGCDGKMAHADIIGWGDFPLQLQSLISFSREGINGIGIECPKCFEKQTFHDMEGDVLENWLDYLQKNEVKDEN